MSAAWTSTRGKCHFCTQKESGHARRDESGEYFPACFECAKKPYSVPNTDLKETTEAQ